MPRTRDQPQRLRLSRVVIKLARLVRRGVPIATSVHDQNRTVHLVDAIDGTQIRGGQSEARLELNGEKWCEENTGSSHAHAQTVRYRLFHARIDRFEDHRVDVDRAFAEKSRCTSE